MLSAIHNTLLAAILAFGLLGSAVQAQTPELDALFEQLQADDVPNWETLEREIWRLWSQSGSAAMDFLLERGRDAMAAGDFTAAIEHLTALTDHAPEFAEGWNTRATAYYLADLYGPSIVDIQRTLELNPNHFGALSGLGQILKALSENDASLSAFRQAAAIHPHRPDIQQAIEQLERLTEGQSL
ncbi:MAG: tetratricopeptide (TPR) repeat protein [Paracoccaceae bacterium]|jgi:tetratricopeptide (TPR) repeat protein